MMRSLMLSIVVSILVALSAPVPASGLVDSRITSAASVFELQSAQPPKDDVDVNAHRDGAGVPWYRNPVRIAVGGVFILVTLWFVVLVIRAGGTTVGDAGYEDRIRSLDER